MTPQKYSQINELLSEYSSINAQLESAESAIKLEQLDAAQELLPTHAELKIKLTAVEGKLRVLADEFYDELFPKDEEKRTHATPFGALKYHKSSSLEFDDEEKVLLKIAAACAADRTGRFMAEQLIRTRKEPNLDAMGGFDNATLAVFGIRRVQKDNFKIQPFAMKTDKVKKVVAA